MLICDILLFKYERRNIMNHILTNDAIDIDLGVAQFLNHVKAERSMQTFLYYQKHLKVIVNYLLRREITSFKDVNSKVLDDFIIAEKENGNKNITINKRIGALKTASQYLTKQNLLAVPISAGKLKVVTKKIVVLTSEEISKIIKYLQEQPLRSQVLIELIIQTGVRRTEIVNIKIEDVDLDNNRIWLSHTKTNSPRYIFFDDTLKMKISKILDQNRIYLFESENHEPLSTSTLDSIFLRMKKRLSIKLLSPHLLRHTFATSILQNGGNLEEVRLLLGHSSYQMTQRYLHLLQENLKSTSIKYNPMSSL